MFIVLTAEHADAVRGETTPGYMLYPVEAQNGSFFLPVSVLTMPEHAPKHAFLKSLPQVKTVTAKEVPQE